MIEAYPPVDPSELSKDKLVTMVRRLQRLIFAVHDDQGNQIGWDDGDELHNLPCGYTGSEEESHEGLIERLLEIFVDFNLDARAPDDVPIRGYHRVLKPQRFRPRR